MLVERRRAMHERTARAMENMFAGRLEDHFGALARHYLLGNDAGEGAALRASGNRSGSQSRNLLEASNLIEAGLNDR